MSIHAEGCFDRELSGKRGGISCEICAAGTELRIALRPRYTASGTDTSCGDLPSLIMGSVWWDVGRWGVAVLLASYIGASGLKKKSLNKSGAIAVRNELSHFHTAACSIEYPGGPGTLVQQSVRSTVNTSTAVMVCSQC